MAPPNPKKTDKINLTFEDCGGLERQVNYINTALLQPLSQRQSNGRFGLEPPKGILFFGPPGTGKTRLAMALKGEMKKRLGMNVHFMYRKGKDVASKYFGQSSENLRRVFREAEMFQPTILFFDELDGLCPGRDSHHQHQANITIVTTMLGLIDDLPRGKVFIIGATNRLEGIDAALRRPGRFDKHLEFLPPSLSGRLVILKIHTKKWKKIPNEDMLHGVSEDTSGFTGADLANLCMAAFDNALNRFVDSKKNLNLKDISLTDLKVEEKDWKNALKRMKPTNAAIFGSALYTHPRSLGEHLLPPIGPWVNNIKNKIIEILPPTEDRHGGHSLTKSLHVYTDFTHGLNDLDDLVIAEALRSKELDKYTIYSICPTSLASVAKGSWASRVDSTISQCLSSPNPVILYMKQVDALWNLIEGAKIGLSLNLKEQVERIRGSSVILLTSGAHTNDFPANHPLKCVCARGELIDVDTLSEEQIEECFAPICVYAILAAKGAMKFTQAELITLDIIEESIMDATNTDRIGKIVRLYDVLNEEMQKDFTSPQQIIQALATKIGEYRMMY